MFAPTIFNRLSAGLAQLFSSIAPTLQITGEA